MKTIAALLFWACVLQAQIFSPPGKVRRYAGTPTAGDCNANTLDRVSSNSTAIPTEYFTCKQTSAGVYGWVLISDSAATGDITSVTAGTGLTGGGTSGAVTLSLGSHNHAATDINSATLAAARGGLGADASAFAGVLKMSGGAAAVVTGTGSDCVRVDGTSGACSGGGATLPSPAVSVNGAAARLGTGTVSANGILKTLSSACEATPTSGTGTIRYWYNPSTGEFVAGHDVTASMTTAGGCGTIVGSTSAYPVDVYPLGSCAVSGGAIGTCTEHRAFGADFTVAGPGLSESLNAHGLRTFTLNGPTIQDEGGNLTVRRTVNFTGAGVSCVDNSGSTRTDCTISGGGGNSTTVFTFAAGSAGQTCTGTGVGAGYLAVDSGDFSAAQVGDVYRYDLWFVKSAGANAAAYNAYLADTDLETIGGGYKIEYANQSMRVSGQVIVNSTNGSQGVYMYSQRDYVTNVIANTTSRTINLTAAHDFKFRVANCSGGETIQFLGGTVERLRP